MARIRSIETGTQAVKPHTSEVDAYVQIISADPEGPLVHLSTFGSDARASAPKSSQSMQFDREQAGELIAKFVEAFGPGIIRSASEP